MSTLNLDATTTAVLVIDMQNDNVLPEGAFADFGAAAHAAEQNVVENVATVLAAARAADVAVVHNRIVAYPGRPSGGTNAPIFRLIGPESLLLGSWGAAPVDGLQPVGDELDLLRIRMSAFNGTALDTVLRNYGVTAVVIVGVWTNMAVEHTARDAADHGYEVTVVSDATSSINAEWQHAALNFALTNIATIATTAEVQQAFGTGTRA
ncbi:MULTISPECIES: cysteine hydrolase family protein [unclassified Modestobacter]